MTDVKGDAGLASDRWQELTLVQQLGNIGSEVGRALRPRPKTTNNAWKPHWARTLELFHLTIADPRLIGVCRNCRG